VENLQQIEKPFSVSFNASSSIDEVDGKIIISPFSGYTFNVNPLKQPSRTYPIDMLYKKRRTFMSTIHIPKGYKLFSNPANVTIDNDDIKIIYQFNVENDSIVKVLGIYDFKRDIYSSSKYVDLKKYYNTIIDKFNERLIFVKE